MACTQTGWSRPATDCKTRANTPHLEPLLPLTSALVTPSHKILCWSALESYLWYLPGMELEIWSPACSSVPVDKAMEWMCPPCRQNQPHRSQSTTAQTEPPLKCCCQIGQLRRRQDSHWSATSLSPQVLKSSARLGCLPSGHTGLAAHRKGSHHLDRLRYCVVAFAHQLVSCC